jgi:hypothetical protein
MPGKALWGLPPAIGLRCTYRLPLARRSAHITRKADTHKAAAGAHAAAACDPPNPSGRHVWVDREGPHGWQRVWRDPEENDFHDPPEFDRAAVIAYHNAMPQRLRDCRNMQSLARGLAAPAEATRLRLLEPHGLTVPTEDTRSRLLELHQRLRLHALQPVRRLRQRLRLRPKRDVGHELARAGRCLAEPRARGGGAADADEDAVYMQDFCRSCDGNSRFCDGIHPYSQYQDPPCPCGPANVWLGRGAAPPARDPTSALLPRYGPQRYQYDSDSDSDRGLDPDRHSDSDY